MILLAACNPRVHDNISIFVDAGVLHVYYGVQERDRRFSDWRAVPGEHAEDHSGLLAPPPSTQEVQDVQVPQRLRDHHATAPETEEANHQANLNSFLTISFC